MPANLFSVNGHLRPMSEKPRPGEDRGTDYEPVDIGKPLLIQYRHMYLRYTPGKQKLMVSTYLKSVAEKPGAAEAITYYNPEAVFGRSGQVNGEFELANFGARNYGHRLCYYTKAYAGQPISLTSRIMDINRNPAGEAVFDTLKGVVGTLGSIPMFMEFLPYAGAVKSSIELLGKIFTFLTRDREMIRSHDLDLEYDMSNANLLQSGRIVCIPERSDSDILGSDRGLRLDDGNRLVDKEGTPFRDCSYIVLQVDSKKVTEFESFDHFKGAAELLAQTNRGGFPLTSIIESVADMVRSADDVRSATKIDRMIADGGEDTCKHIKAQFELLSPFMRDLYKKRVEEYISANCGQG